MPIDWRKLEPILKPHEQFVLTSHVRPDADAIGSELALAELLRHQGKQVRVVNASQTPPRLSCLDPRSQVLKLGQDIPISQLADAQVVVVLDTSAWQQLGAMADFVSQTTAVKVIIDHHISADDLGATVFRDPEAAATGELVFEAATAMGWPLTPEVANLLFAAVATDTGWFRFSSVRSSTLSVAARLVDAGASPDKLYQELNEQDTLSRLKLRGLALERMQVVFDGQVAYTTIHREDFARTGAKPPDTEELVNDALSLAGVEVGLIFIEQLQGGVKVSFRSRGRVDCSRWAEAFGGGGHHQAAGAILPDPISAAVDTVLSTLRKLW